MSFNLLFTQTVDLSKLKSSTLDFKNVHGFVLIKGDYKGQMLTFKNIKDIKFKFEGLVDIKTDRDHAIILDNPENVEILSHFKGQLRLNNSITVKGNCKNLIIEGVIINNCHTAIRINQQGLYNNITIRNCIIRNCSHEGIYIGTSYKNIYKTTRNVNIYNNMISHCGWDGIQVGNCLDFNIHENLIHNCGFSKEYGQDFDITINPGSRGHLYENTLSGTIQILDSRAFINKKKSHDKN